MRKFETVIDLSSVLDRPTDIEYDESVVEEDESFSETRNDIFCCQITLLLLLCLLGISYVISRFIFIFI